MAVSSPADCSTSHGCSCGWPTARGPCSRIAARTGSCNSAGVSAWAIRSAVDITDWGSTGPVPACSTRSAESLRPAPRLRRCRWSSATPGYGSGRAIPQQADPASIPDFAFVSASDDVRDHLAIEGNYEFVTDNLMDLSHAEFIHRESFGVNGSLLTHGAHSVVQDDDGAIWSNWDITDAIPPDWAKPLVVEGARIDQWLHMRWHAPASMALGIGLARAGSDRQDLVLPPMRNPHIITPETGTTSHYFYTREPGEKSAARARQVFQQEDEPMIASAQSGFAGQDFWEARPIILPSDAAAIRARRRLMQLRRAEAS